MDSHSRAVAYLKVLLPLAALVLLSTLFLISRGVNTALSGLEASSPGPVRATGAIGKLTAGNMQISAKTEGGPVHMLFKNGVKLLYEPQQPER